MFASSARNLKGMPNRLLSKADLEMAKARGSVFAEPPAERRIALYHAEHGCRIFEGDAAAEEAMAQGWVDDPVDAKPGALPRPSARAKPPDLKRKRAKKPTEPGPFDAPGNKGG